MDKPLFKKEEMNRSKISEEWKERFRTGDRSTIEDCYRKFFPVVMRSAGRYLDGPDQESVAQEVFYRLINSQKMRTSFHGNNLVAWLHMVTRNQALDYIKHRNRETSMDPDKAMQLVDTNSAGPEIKIECKILIERFIYQYVPTKWVPIFKARFIDQLTQRETAKLLNIPRTTIKSREIQLKKKLKRFIFSLERK